MDVHIFVALVGALINMGLSVSVPVLIKKSEQPFLVQVRKVFETNRQVILTSSLIVGVTIYLALKVAPELENGVTNLTGLSFGSSVGSDDVPRRVMMSSGRSPYQLRFLSGLNQ